MCIISGEIERVYGTKIIAAKVKGQSDKQLTIYSNEVDTQNPVSMILPYPIAGVKPVIIETNSKDYDIFDSIDYTAFQMHIFSLGLSRGNGISKRNSLKVHRSGSYQYSIATSAKELSQLNNKVFNIKNDLQTLLDDYLSRGFGFIICIIDKGAKYSPFAYISSIRNNLFFVPTKHYHEHNRSNNSSNEYSDDWDHAIYILGAKNGNAYNDLNVNSAFSFSNYLDNYSKENLFKQEISGRAVNKDLFCPVC